MDSITICYDCFSMEVFPLNLTIYSWETMLTGAGKASKLYAYCSLTRSNIRERSLFFVEIINPPQLLAFMDFMNNVKID